MPQMSPLNWLSMYIYFYLLFLLLMIINYYLFLYKPKTHKFKKLSKINWKW
uniref:ATP synthase complex subunit 8 n=1 Tax=Curculionidae sp. 6 AH-2016 TaxID=1903832 RepID=A0A343C2S2_9CUCU|nr:ATP synthase F0 subunit 8 [Curculionidae sp. 6 AH-2016]